jgi:hypothetical protein
VAGFANPSAASLLARKIPFFPEMRHSMSQKPIGFGLIAAAVGFEPCDDVGIQPYRYGLLRWPIELPDFGTAPIKDRRRIRKINVLARSPDLGSSGELSPPVESSLSRELGVFKKD